MYLNGIVNQMLSRVFFENTCPVKTTCSVMCVHGCGLAKSDINVEVLYILFEYLLYHIPLFVKL